MEVQSGTEVTSVVAVPAVKSTSEDPQCHTHNVIKTIATVSQYRLPGVQTLPISRGS